MPRSVKPPTPEQVALATHLRDLDAARSALRAGVLSSAMAANETGLSARSIALVTGVPVGTVFSWLREGKLTAIVDKSEPDPPGCTREAMAAAVLRALGVSVKDVAIHEERAAARLSEEVAAAVERDGSIRDRRDLAVSPVAAPTKQPSVPTPSPAPRVTVTPFMRRRVEEMATRWHAAPGSCNIDTFRRRDREGVLPDDQRALLDEHLPGWRSERPIRALQPRRKRSEWRVEDALSRLATSWPTLGTAQRRDLALLHGALRDGRIDDGGTAALDAMLPGWRSNLFDPGTLTPTRRSHIEAMAALWREGKESNALPAGRLLAGTIPADELDLLDSLMPGWRDVALARRRWVDRPTRDASPLT